ncbi:hypothetical protein H312_03399 [Anncaliia algerae PRA339]|uniref:Uncharacterized protein n=1 Tax=Anncaliia algerae PRA339 TaxID=1288291 RepID=A0A059EWW7_9MICR|nr:hypothetical protein H312_03399 [Anncaliia algerae PRA339]
MIKKELEKNNMEISYKRLAQILYRCLVCKENDIKVVKTCEYVTSNYPGEKMG